ncbi:hypothetical protein CDS [Bradyrhizobium sp.]|nr:hypothetical protein CDS [Bradyrhizobium sp.]
MSPNNAGIPIRDLIIRSPSNASFVLMATGSGTRRSRDPRRPGCVPSGASRRLRCIMSDQGQ